VRVRAWGEIRLVYLAMSAPHVLAVFGCLESNFFEKYKKSQISSMNYYALCSFKFNKKYYVV
jgi:hypothetical protein